MMKSAFINQGVLFLILYSSRSAIIFSVMPGFQKIISESFSQGNSAHNPQNCTWCSLVQVCTLHLPDSAHSGTRPSDSIQPGHPPSSFFGHLVQHSPQAVTVEKSVISYHLPFVLPLVPNNSDMFLSGDYGSGLPHFFRKKRKSKLPSTVSVLLCAKDIRSGWNWTLHIGRVSCSIASTTPSCARSTTRKPFPGRSTPW